jgi:hypothetical protein
VLLQWLQMNCQPHAGEHRASVLPDTHMIFGDWDQCLANAQGCSRNAPELAESPLPLKITTRPHDAVSSSNWFNDSSLLRHVCACKHPLHQSKVVTLLPLWMPLPVLLRPFALPEAVAASIIPHTNFKRRCHNDKGGPRFTLSS